MLQSASRVFFAASSLFLAEAPVFWLLLKTTLLQKGFCMIMCRAMAQKLRVFLSWVVHPCLYNSSTSTHSPKGHQRNQSMHFLADVSTVGTPTVTSGTPLASPAVETTWTQVMQRCLAIKGESIEKTAEGIFVSPAAARPSRYQLEEPFVTEEGCALAFRAQPDSLQVGPAGAKTHDDSEDAKSAPTADVLVLLPAVPEQAFCSGQPTVPKAAL